MSSLHHQASEDLRLRVLHLLQQQPGLSQRQLAQRLGISHGKAHYCLRALLDVGWIKLNNFAHSPHRLGYAYLLTPQGLSSKVALTQRFLQRKQAEFEALRAEIDELQRSLPGSAHPLEPGDA